MTIHLGNPTIDRLAREVAAMEGVSVDGAIETALTDHRARLLRERDKQTREVMEILEEICLPPVLDPRTANDTFEVK